METPPACNLRLIPALLVMLLLTSTVLAKTEAGEGDGLGEGYFFFGQDFLMIAQQTNGLQNITFLSGEVWIEVHCGAQCAELTLNLTDSSGAFIDGVQSGEFITLSGNVTAGNATIRAATTGIQFAELQSVLPLGNWEEIDLADSIPMPGADTSTFGIHEVADSRYPLTGSIGCGGGMVWWCGDYLWSESPDWINGSIDGAGDVDVLLFEALPGDVFEVWLEHSSIALEVEAIGRSTQSLNSLGEIAISANTSIGGNISRMLVGAGDDEQFWLKVSSEEVGDGLYALRISHHIAALEYNSSFEFPGSQSPATDENAIEVNAGWGIAQGWLSASVGEEDCIILPTQQVNSSGNDVQVATGFIAFSANTTTQVSYLLDGSWITISEYYEHISNPNNISVTVYSPAGTTTLRYCLASEEVTSWVALFYTVNVSDSPGELPSSSEMLNAGWGRLGLNSTTQGELVTSIYDSSDLLWYEVDGWPESEFLIRVSIDNIGTEPIRVTLQEINWSSRAIIESVNITIDGSKSEELTMKVGPGIHTVKIEHLNLIEQGGIWQWGGEPDLPNTTYRIYTTVVQTEVGEKPWFEADPRVAEASQKLLLFFGICLALPFVWVVLKQRAAKKAAQGLIGKKARLAHLLELLAKGEIYEARADLSTNLRIISTLTWEEGVEVWGRPDLHHRTESVDLAAWRLDTRLGKKGGMPILVGVHVIEDTWEVVGLRCEAPEGMAWKIVRAEPRLLFRQDELFLDQLHQGTRTFVEIEIIGDGSGIEFSLSGTVKGEPSAMKTPTAMMIDVEEE
ncbi:MAG TPA: hypothetical protein EYN46_05520 [Candidatus Poseidoniales archaeon]|nr:hypothetical protein [Candidatus Poseidoniales archaeon]HIO94799.1 hypothetical protein [Candidatus Poseidoniales archaeon]